MSLNKVLLIGNVGRDPEIRYIANEQDKNSSTKVATIRLATNDKFYKNSVLHEITEWHTIIAWGRLADLAEEYIKKGSALFVEGKIRTRSWFDKEENLKYVTEIVAENVQLLGKKTEEESQNQKKTNASILEQAQKSDAFKDIEEFDESDYPI